MRTNFITHFFCSTCGKQLELVYESDIKTTSEKFEEQIPVEPTGASCLYNSKIFIKPCQDCIDKYTLPAKKLIEVIKQIEKET